MDKNKIESTINEIDEEKNIQIKYENIIKLHKMIDKEGEKLEKLNEKIERIETTKYDNMDLDKIISKFNKTECINKKIKYYYAISNKIDNIINTINK